jgi:hypothetical protein
MRILPSDLTTEWLVRIVQLRDGRAGAPAREPHLGWWGRRCAEGSGLDRERAAAAMPAAGATVGGVLAAICSIGTMLLLIPGMALMHDPLGTAVALPLSLLAALAASGSGGVLACRRLFRGMVSRPLATEELDMLLGQVQDDLHRRFLTLVKDAVRAHGSGATEENVRAALGALAEAVASLPPLESQPLDTVALRNQAAELELQAHSTTDRVIAESLGRRAAALGHTADAHDRSVLLVQRSKALRSEIEAQMDALREGLVALQSHSRDGASLAVLASSARTVAGEAANLAVARQELDTAVGTWPAPAREQPVVQVRG